MDHHERSLRNAAASFRMAKPTWAQPRTYLAEQAVMWDHLADVVALDGLDLSDLYAPTPGDALALRGGALAVVEPWRELASCEDVVNRAERSARAHPDPGMSGYLLDSIMRVRGEMREWVASMAYAADAEGEL